MSSNIHIFIISISILRVLIAPFFGLGVDEAHYVLYAKNLDFSYFDHPPLVGFIHALFYYTVGSNELIARVPAILIFSITSYLVYDFILNIFKNKNIAIFSVIAVNSSFILSALSIMMMPDSILFMLVFLLIKAVINLQKDRDNIKNWLFLGVVLDLILNLILGLFWFSKNLTKLSKFKWEAISFLDALVWFDRQE